MSFNALSSWLGGHQNPIRVLRARVVQAWNILSNAVSYFHNLTAECNEQMPTCINVHKQTVTFCNCFTLNARGCLIELVLVGFCFRIFLPRARGADSEPQHHTTQTINGQQSYLHDNWANSVCQHGPWNVVEESEKMYASGPWVKDFLLFI